MLPSKDTANEDESFTPLTTNQQLMNTQEMEEKTMRDQLQAVEREITLAKVELAKKDNIFKNQQKLIAELQAKYKFELDKRNKK